MPLIARDDIAIAFGLMTRLPLRVDPDRAKARGAAVAWAWPLAGAMIGAVAGTIFLGAISLSVPPLTAALIAVAVQIILTGALHEDGLADSADGLWGGWTVERRLEIMRDSRIGSYGVLALVISVGLRASLIASFAGTGQAFAALVASGAISRAAMVWVMTCIPSARRDGLSASTGRPSRATATLGSALALATGFVLPVFTLPIVALAVVAAALGCRWIAAKKIGGQTGDILGATQQVTEIVSLLALSCLLVSGG